MYRVLSAVIVLFCAAISQELVVPVASVVTHFNVHDVDLPPDTIGAAVVETTSDLGFSRDNGMTWEVIPADTQLGWPLERDWLLRIPPSTTLGVRAWDGTAGIAGSPIDITETGGDSAFSEAVGIVEVSNATVAEDRRLGLSWKALSINANIATLTNVTYTINPPSMATVQLPVQGDDPAVNFFVKPSGTLGTLTVTVSGTNRNGQVKSSQPYSITVIAGAAETIQVAAVGEFALAGVPELPRVFVDTTFDPKVMKLLSALKALQPTQPNRKVWSNEELLRYHD